MFVIIWEYQVKPEYIPEFEKIYSAKGAWAELFKESEGFLEIQLLRDRKNTCRYITIDQWTSLADYEAFLLHRKTEYETLDAYCEDMTEQERLLGTWEQLLGEIR